jgi:uncharacterized protein YjhX (UPF0386 family)
MLTKNIIITENGHKQIVYVRLGLPIHGNLEAGKGKQVEKDQSGTVLLVETDTEHGLNDYDLKRACYAHAKATFQGKTFINIETGRPISVSRSGIGEWRTKSKSREQILSIKILDKLLEDAHFDHDADDKANRLDIEKISYFRCPCVINSQRKEAIITVRYIRNEGDKYYHHYLEDIKIEPYSGQSRPA